MVVVVGPGCRFNGDFGHHRSHPHGLASGRNQAIAQPECAQTGCVGGMTFGPGGGIGESLGHNNGPVGCQHGGNSSMAGLFQARPPHAAAKAY